jgi:hypothetical protein
LACLPLVRGSAQCEAKYPRSINDGVIAFQVLMSAEVGLGAVFGRSLVDQLAASKSPPGAIGLGAQMMFATFPVIQVLRR